MKIKKHFSKLIENWPMKIASLLFALILFMFYRRSLLEKRYFSVPLNIKSTSTLVPASNYPRTVKISLWGEGISISPIHEEDVMAYLDLTQYAIEGEYRMPIKIELKGTALNIHPLEVSVEPQDIRLKLEQSITKKVPVILSLKGSTSEDFEVSQTLIDPSTIEITGPISVLEKINNMITESVIIEDRNMDFAGSATLLNTNPLVFIVGGGQIDYKVRIKGKVDTIEHSVSDILIENLSDKFSISTPIPPITISVKGTKSFLSSWIPPKELLKIDCSVISAPGTYELPVDVASVENAEILNVDPQKVKLTVIHSKDDNSESN